MTIIPNTQISLPGPGFDEASTAIVLTPLIGKLSLLQQATSDAVTSVPFSVATWMSITGLSPEQTAIASRLLAQNSTTRLRNCLSQMIDPNLTGKHKRILGEGMVVKT